VGRLTARFAATATPGDYLDGSGLYLCVAPTLSRSWVYRFSWHGRRLEMDLGRFPHVSLAEARALRDEASRALRSGRNPIEETDSGADQGVRRPHARGRPQPRRQADGDAFRLALRGKHPRNRIRSLAVDEGSRAKSPYARLPRRCRSLQAGRSACNGTQDLRGAVNVLAEINRQPGVRAHRPHILQACFRTLNSCNCADEGKLYETAVRVREENRLVGRPLPKRAVGSTLLLKGLEAEVAVILNPVAMDAKHLYVAMTRASHRLVICSPTRRPDPIEYRDHSPKCPLLGRRSRSIFEASQRPRFWCRLSWRHRPYSG
jgi:hypothetical protein